MSNSNFPLYDNLSSGISARDLTTKQKNEFMSKVKNIDENGAELIYALIRVFQMENSEDNSTFKLPYDGKYSNNDMKFDLNQLPNQLKQILYKFIQLHTESMKEENKLTETRLDIGIVSPEV